MGRLANALPTDQKFDATATPRTPALGDAYGVWQAKLDALLSDLHNAPPEDIALDGGKLTPNDSASIRVQTDPENDDDQLLQIELSAVADGRMVFLSCPSDGTPITVKHMAGDLSDEGEISLAGNSDYVLSDPRDFLALRRIGGQFIQVRQIGTAAAASRVGPLQADVDMNGYAAIGGAFAVREHTNSARTITVAMRGTKQVNKANCVYTLPNSQPGGGSQWKVGDFILFRQEASSCTFVRAGGGTPRNIDGHDRGRGVGAEMQAELVQISPSFVWNLLGMTTAAGGGGGAISRTYAKAASVSTISTDAGSTAWKDALVLTHTPGSNETWLYLGHGGFKGSANAATMSSLARIYRAAASAGPTFGGPRYTSGQEAPLLMMGAAYGASPGSQDISIGVKSGNTSYATSVISPALVGLRLETGEFMQLGAGSNNNVSGTTYADLLTLTQTFGADDFYILVWCQWETGTQVGMTLRVDVDGATVHEKAMSFHTAQPGYFGVLVPRTLTAASHTIKLQAKCNHSGFGTLTNMGICALKKGAFQDASSANDGSTTTTMSTSYVDKETLSDALLASWDYLVLGDVDLMVDNQSSGVGANAQLARNGTRIGQAARSVPRDPSTWCPVSAGAMAVIQAGNPTDNFALQVASQQGADTVTAKEASIVLLALAAI